MAAEKYLKAVQSLFERSPVVDARSIAKTVASRGGDAAYAKQLIRLLLASGRITRLTKGFYTTLGDPSLVVFCFQPAYLGLQDALAFHGLTEQETMPVIVTSRHVRQGLRTVMEQNVMIRRLDKRYLFGFEYYKQGDLYLPYSDPEKTVIDLAYFGVDMKQFKGLNKADARKMRAYLKRYPERTMRKVLGKIGMSRPQ